MVGCWIICFILCIYQKGCLLKRIKRVILINIGITRLFVRKFYRFEKTTFLMEDGLGELRQWYDKGYFNQWQEGEGILFPLG